MHLPIKLISTALIFAVSFSSASATIDETINEVVQPVTDIISSFIFYSISLFGTDVPLIVCWLIFAACFFTVYLGFINLRGFKHAIDIVSGKFSDSKHDGEITHFQALTAAVSGTVGIGNIAGVAITISIGGAGAIFWLMVAGLIGMTTKFVECSLGVKYRKINPDGSVSGGPMYYLSEGLSKKGMPKLGKFLGMFFAISIVIGCLGIGNMFQSNQAYMQLLEVSGGKDGSPLVRAITSIFQGAFSTQSAAGGILGAMIIGFQRAAFSNEAGLGSAAIAHSAVKTDSPLTEGFVGLLEPFIDTVVICTLTALVLVTTFPSETISGGTLSGIELTSASFASSSLLAHQFNSALYSTLPTL